MMPFQISGGGSHPQLGPKKVEQANQKAQIEFSTGTEQLTNFNTAWQTGRVFQDHPILSGMGNPFEHSGAEWNRHAELKSASTRGSSLCSSLFRRGCLVASIAWFVVFLSNVLTEKELAPRQGEIPKSWLSSSHGVKVSRGFEEIMRRHQQIMVCTKIICIGKQGRGTREPYCIQLQITSLYPNRKVM